MAAGKTSSRSARTPSLGFGFAALAVVAAAINLRAGIASVAPVIDDIATAFDVSAGTAGLLTALPGFLFALMGWGAVPLARRAGFTPVIAAGGALITAGLALRPFVGGSPLFLVLTTAVVAGIAVGNVLLPAWIKTHVPDRQAVGLMSAYTAILGLSGAIAPLSALCFSGDAAWKWAIGVWAIPAVAQLVVWALALLRTGRDTPRGSETENQEPASGTQATAGAGSTAEERAARRAAAKAPLWKSPTAVAMLLFFGTQSSMAYTQMGWLPQMLMDQGVSSGMASVTLAILGAFNVAGGVIMPQLAARMRRLTVVPVALAALTFAGWLGVFAAPAAAPILWGTLLGIGGMCFPLAIALLAQRTKSPLVTARLSGFVQPGGYLLAGLVPLVVGWLYGLTGGWAASLWLLMIMCAGLLVFGVRATRDIYIDDELVAA